MSIADQLKALQDATNNTTSNNSNATSNSIPTNYSEWSESSIPQEHSYISKYSTELPCTMDLDKPILNMIFEIKFKSSPTWFTFAYMPLYTFGYNYSKNEDIFQPDVIKELHLRIGLDYLEDSTNPKFSNNYNTLLNRPIVVHSGRIGAYSSIEVLESSLPSQVSLNDLDVDLNEDVFNENGSMRGAINLKYEVKNDLISIGSIYLNFYEDNVREQNIYQKLLFDIAQSFAEDRRNNISRPWDKFTDQFELRIAGFEFAQENISMLEDDLDI